MREILSMAASDAPDANPLIDKASLQPFPPTPADAAVAAAATRTHDPTARHDVKESPPALAWRLRLPSSHRRRVREKKIRGKKLPAGRPLTGHCDSTAPPAHHPHVSFFFLLLLPLTRSPHGATGRGADGMKVRAASVYARTTLARHCLPPHTVLLASRAWMWWFVRCGRARQSAARLAKLGDARVGASGGASASMCVSDERDDVVKRSDSA